MRIIDRKCGPSEFKCNNSLCISAAFKCDGQNDCRDNSDENDELCGECILCVVCQFVKYNMCLIYIRVS